MFDYAVEHASRVARVLKCPGGHALLIGFGGNAYIVLHQFTGYEMGIFVSFPYCRLWQAIIDSFSRVCAPIRRTFRGFCVPVLMLLFWIVGCRLLWIEIMVFKNGGRICATCSKKQEEARANQSFFWLPNLSWFLFSQLLSSLLTNFL